MNAYDFDNTIYRGDSTARFYMYCLARTPRMALRVPSLIYHALFTLKRDKQGFKQRMFGFLRDLSDTQAMVEAFWRRDFKRVKRFYAGIKRPDDVIISASPEFLLAPACARLGIGTLIASPVDARTGQYSGKNCHGEEKLRRFREIFGDASVHEFYSDSLSDAPMARAAQAAFIVKGEKLAPWPEKSKSARGA